MRSILYSVLILIPVLVWSQKCPKFQAVIPLRPSATALNLSYAMVADGKYYLLQVKDISLKTLEPTGVMPKGFEESRLITVVDKSKCNESQYYLIAIQSFRSSDQTVEIKFSTLDLKNFEPMSQWSQPKPISENPIFANDPYLKMWSEFDPSFEIENLVHTIFYWEQTQTYFVVIKSSRKDGLTKSSLLRYYQIDAQNTCDRIHLYSKKPENLSFALNSVIEPLDLCYFSHFTGLSDPLLYCLGGPSFQVNSVLSELKNGSIRTETIKTPESDPTIDRLRVLGRLCKEETPTSGPETNDMIRVRINEIKIGVVPNVPNAEYGPIGAEEDIRHRMNDTIDRAIDQGQPEPMSDQMSVSSSEKPEGDSSSTFIIVLVCLAMFVVVMIGILIIAARRQQQIAKM